MVQLVFSPKWFYGIDCIFEVISIVVLLLLAYSSYKLYKFTRKKDHLYFGVSFLTLVLAFLAKITTNFEIYFAQAIKQVIGPDVITTVTKVVQSSLLFMTGFFVYRLFFLLGLLGLFYIIPRSKERRHVPVYVYFALIVSLFSTHTYFVFHITAAILLIYISFFLYLNYEKKKKKIPGLTFISFLMLATSQIIFIFVVVNPAIYVAAEIIQLLGFLMLLYSYILLIRK